MKILSRKQQIECIKRLNSIRIITDDMNEKAYGEEVKKWAENVEYLADNIIEIANIVYGIQGMQVIEYFVRKDMSEQLKEQYKEDTNLKDTIREIHDNVAQEMYCKGVDDFVEKVELKYLGVNPDELYEKYYPREICEQIKEIAKQLKEQK